MATQVKITFTALNGDISPSERVLNLDPDHRTVQIGRASKSPAKGLQGAVDNAWFDSPVMSRNHAEIILDTQGNIVTIQDIGSMHGTFVNNLELQRREPRGLSNGDVVVFGAEVRRGFEVFPACAFRIDYEFLPVKSSNVYAFPDSDDEEYEISDDEMEQNEEQSSEDGASIESPPLKKASQAIHAIDLTRDDSPVDSSVPDQKSAGETTLENRSMAGRPAHIDCNADPVSIAIYAGNAPIVVESDDEDSHSSADSDDQSEEVESLDDGSSQSDEHDASDNEDADDHQMVQQEKANPHLRDFPDKEAESVSGLASLGHYTFANHPIPESNLRTLIEASQDVMEGVIKDMMEDEDDESDFGLSEAGAEGIRTLFDDGLLDNSAVNPYFEAEDEKENDSDSVIACEGPSKTLTADEKLETPKRVTFAQLPSEILPEMTNSSFSHYTQPSRADSAPSQAFMVARQPSPSDAAMVKIAIPSTQIFNQIPSPVPIHHFPSQEFHELTAQSLGEKTGKHAFFAAREDNKAKIHGGESVQPTRSTLPQTVNTVATSDHEDLQEIKRQRSLIAMRKCREQRQRIAEEGTVLSEPHKIVHPVSSTAITAVDFNKSFEEKSYVTGLTLSTIPYLSNFLDNHAQTPELDRAPNPEPDMTSAVMYNQSKALIDSANKVTSPPTGRSGLSIDDIIDSPASDLTKTLKRKAEDISDVIDNEVRIWASSPPTSDISNTSTEVPAPTNVVEQRPAKRLRKIVESFGYVALGGATLFGALVLSAPDFL